MWHGCIRTCSSNPNCAVCDVAAACMLQLYLLCLCVLLQEDGVSYKHDSKSGALLQRRTPQQMQSHNVFEAAGNCQQVRTTSCVQGVRDKKCMLGGRSACWGQKMHAGDTKSLLWIQRHAGDSLECDRSSSCPAIMPARLSDIRMMVTPSGPGLAQLLCLFFINSQDAASLEASL